VFGKAIASRIEPDAARGRHEPISESHADVPDALRARQLPAASSLGRLTPNEYAEQRQEQPAV
jgi:hypothetical protein